MPITTRGLTHVLPLCAFRMKCCSIFSVTSKLAITPSLIGRIATMFPGVRPSISFASLPTASTQLVTLFMATMEGSLSTTPRPLAKTSVFAVPRSIAKSLERSPEMRGKDIVHLNYLCCVNSISSDEKKRQETVFVSLNKDKHYLNYRKGRCQAKF